MAFEATIRVTQVTPVQYVGQKRSPKRMLVGIDLDSNPQYPRYMAFDAFGERAGEVGDELVGKNVCVSFWPESREWNGRFFTNLRFLGCTVEDGAEGAEAATAGQDEEPPFLASTPSASVREVDMTAAFEAEDMPF